MCDGSKDQPFRVQLIFYDEMKSVQAIPLNGLPSSVSDEMTGAMLHGRDEVASFAAGIGIDSIVQTRQLSDQPLILERIFHTLPPNEIIGAVERRFDARHEADIKILGGQRLTETDRAALSDFECIVLGSTELRSTVGFRRMGEWCNRRQRSTG
jgi:hypothetical protein